MLVLYSPRATSGHWRLLQDHDIDHLRSLRVQGSTPCYSLSLATIPRLEEVYIRDPRAALFLCHDRSMYPYLRVLETDLNDSMEVYNLQDFVRRHPTIEDLILFSNWASLTAALWLLCGHTPNKVKSTDVTQGSEKSLVRRNMKSLTVHRRLNAEIDHEIDFVKELVHSTRSLLLDNQAITIRFRGAVEWSAVWSGRVHALLHEYPSRLVVEGPITWVP